MFALLNVLDIVALPKNAKGRAEAVVEFDYNGYSTGRIKITISSGKLKGKTYIAFMEEDERAKMWPDFVGATLVK